jgi:ribosomal protein S18 acetylase RimI-like enzyme
MATHVRFATAADLDSALRLLVAQLQEHQLPVDEEGMRRTLAQVTQPGASWAWLLLAERDGEPVGVCLANRILSVEWAGVVLWVEELYVAPAARRIGVASDLLRHLIEEGRRLGIRSVELEVVPTQAAAFALYDRLGFRHLDRKRLSRAI